MLLLLLLVLLLFLANLTNFTCSFHRMRKWWWLIYQTTFVTVTLFTWKRVLNWRCIFILNIHLEFILIIMRWTYWFLKWCRQLVGCLSWMLRTQCHSWYIISIIRPLTLVLLIYLMNWAGVLPCWHKAPFTISYGSHAITCLMADFFIEFTTNIELFVIVLIIAWIIAFIRILLWGHATWNL